MPMIVPSFFGDYLLNRLLAFSQEKVVMILGVKDELNKLARKMRRIGAYLKDAERRRISDASVNNWLNELKDVMYDADDIIDLCSYANQSLSCDDQPSSSNSATSWAFPQLSSFRSISLRHEVDQKIKALNARLEEIFTDMANLNLQHIHLEVQGADRVDPYISSPIMEVDIVGDEIEDSAKKLVKMAVTNDKQKFNLIAIAGMGGIGKTTLAQKIYNDRTMKNRYLKRMWLSVSQCYSPTQLIKEAIRNAGGDPGNAEREPELLPILADVIHGKSVFLVLDDVWNHEHWVSSLFNAVKSSSTYGFVLVTTRDQRVALRMGAKYIHQIKALAIKSSWELLCNKSYLIDTTDIRHLQEVGLKIVEKCGGLPLAINAIAGMLATKSKSKNEWESVLKSSAWSIGGLPEEIDRALYLSYEDLSPQLKQCFLYCSLYPPNHVIIRADLVRLWIAEGLVEERSNQSVENIAEDYYYELIRRHLLEPYHLFADHSRCKMHDLLRSLARYLSKEESFGGDQSLPHHDALYRLHHLSIKETNKQICISGAITEQLKLRTFMIFHCQSKIGSDVFGRLKNLRVLYISEHGLNHIPESIGDMIHLRLLHLDRTSISLLPESIGCLTNLLFLNLSSCKFLYKLPKGVTRLCNLHHLKLNNTPLTCVPKGIGVLKKLTKIWGFQVVGDENHDEFQDGWDLQELEGLSQLRRVWLTKLERVRNISFVLANKIHLKQLILDFSKVIQSSNNFMEELENEKNRVILEKLHPPPCIEDLTINNYRGETLPIWMSSSSLYDFLPNLQYLELTRWSCCMDLPPLGLLPNLKYLKVIGASSIVRISSEFHGISVRNCRNLTIVFPRLEYLLFEDMPNWEEWMLYDIDGENTPSRQLMPHIKKLSIVKCPKLIALPQGLQHLTTIEDLVVKHSSCIKSIKDFPFECQNLSLENNKFLDTLFNLPAVKWLKVYHMHNLRYVRKLDSVDHITLINYKINCLPEWLLILMQERKEHPEHKLRLELFCNTNLFQRCLKDGPDWPIIKNFFSVNVYNEGQNATLEYTSKPESYNASLEHNQKDLLNSHSKETPGSSMLIKRGRKILQS